VNPLGQAEDTPKRELSISVDRIHKLLQNSTDLMGRSKFNKWSSTQLPNSCTLTWQGCQPLAWNTSWYSCISRDSGVATVQNRNSDEIPTVLLVHQVSEPNNSVHGILSENILGIQECVAVISYCLLCELCRKYMKVYEMYAYCARLLRKWWIAMILGTGDHKSRQAN
jgi:hypothetical protein